MKPKKITKKLVLKKTTVADLTNREMQDLLAGYDTINKETLENTCCLICGGTTTCPSESMNCPPSSAPTVYTCYDPCK